MANRVLFLLLAVLSFAAAPARADAVDDAVATFINEDGFAPDDVAELDVLLLKAFLPSGGAMRPDEFAGPLEKSLLLVDTLEPRLPRVRYMLRYGQMIQDGTPVSFVTVERYNLGPTIRADVAAAYGEDNVDTPEAFGVGPHVAWRIVTMPLMGQAAALMEASRQEIPDSEAALTDCAGRPCLSTDRLIDDLLPWQEYEADIDINTAFPSVNEAGASDPAFAAAELAVASGLSTVEGDKPYWNGPEQPEAVRFHEPFLFVTIDYDLGQDTMVDAMLGQTQLNDDSIEEIWHRRVQIPDVRPPGLRYWMQATRQRTR